MTPADGPLTREAVLEAAEDVLRRYGPAKATVVDVARALGVSHGSVYRHVASKAQLRDAVTERWLARVAAPLEAIVIADGPAPERLRAYLRALHEAKRAKVLDDPELFATYAALVVDAREVVDDHVEHLGDQVGRIVADGVAAGTLASADPAATARAVLDASARFHNPVHAAEWADPGIGAALDAVTDLLLAGLRPV